MHKTYNEVLLTIIFESGIMHFILYIFNFPYKYIKTFSETSHAKTENVQSFSMDFLDHISAPQGTPRSKF